MLHWPEGPGGPSPRAVTGSRTLVSAVAGQRTSVVLQPRTRLPDRTENLPGFNRALFLLSLTGVPRTRVDLRGLEPRTSALPRRRAPHLRYKPIRPGPENRTRYVLLPKQAGQPAPSPRMPGGRRPPGGRPPTAGYMPSTVDLSKNDERKGGRIRTCNTRCWRPVLWPLSYTPWTATRNAAFPGPGGRRRRVSTRGATPSDAPTDAGTADESGLDGHGNLAARYDPVRIRGLPEHHGRTPWLVGAYVIDDRPPLEGFGNPNSDVRGLDHRETRQKPERLPGKRCRGGADG